MNHTQWYSTCHLYRNKIYLGKLTLRVLKEKDILRREFIEFIKFVKTKKTY